MKKELIDDMKNQTIGVEIEMNEIGRGKAARIVAKVLGTNNYYHDGSDYYDSWYAIDSQGRKWRFMTDASIAGSRRTACEMTTPILHYEDIDMLQKIVRALRKGGAKSDASRNCGVHIHIGADGHTAKTLRNLTNIMASKERMLFDAVGVDSARRHWCAAVNRNYLTRVNAEKPETMDELRNIWYESQGSYANSAIHQHYNSTRYHMLNLHATFTKGTIEFRLFQFDRRSEEHRGGLHAGHLKAYIQLCLAICNYAKHTRFAKWEESVSNDDNPKYTMRMWMNTIGMKGDEFKTARTLYMSRLAGNSDCRVGDRRLCNHRAA